MGREMNNLGEKILSNVLVNDQQSLSTSLDDPCFAFCNADQLSLGKVFTGHGLKNIRIKFVQIHNYQNGSTKRETNKGVHAMSIEGMDLFCHRHDLPLDVRRSDQHSSRLSSWMPWPGH